MCGATCLAATFELHKVGLRCTFYSLVHGASFGALTIIFSPAAARGRPAGTRRLSRLSRSPVPREVQPVRKPETGQSWSHPDEIWRQRDKFCLHAAASASQPCRQGAQCSGFAHLHPPSLVRGTPTIPAGSDERRPPQPSVSRVSAAPQSSLCCPGQEVEASAGGRGQSLHHYTRGLGISGLILIVHWVGGWGVAAIAAAATPRSSFRD